jgi:hypothetical protein
MNVDVGKPTKISVPLLHVQHWGERFHLKQLVRQDAEFRRCRGGQARLTNDVELQTVYWGTNAFVVQKESLSKRRIVKKNHCQQESLSTRIIVKHMSKRTPKKSLSHASCQNIQQNMYDQLTFRCERLPFPNPQKACRRRNIWEK